MGILPFIKKKVEGFSFVFTVYSGLRFCFSPNWNLAPGSFPQTAGEKNPVWKTDTKSGFPHWKKLLHKGSILALSVTFGASSPKGRAFGSPRKLHLFAKASPFGRGGFAKQRRRGRGRVSFWRRLYGFSFSRENAVGAACRPFQPHFFIFIGAALQTR